MPEVSVIIPSYNHAAYLGEAVRSVLGQTLRDLELIVVDDGSKDNSLQVLEGFSDPRLRIIAQENQGAHAAINRGLHAASGEFLAILNSDDAYYPNRLERCLEALRLDPQTGLICTEIEIVDGQGKEIGVKHAYHDCEPWLLPHPERSFRADDDLRAALLTENYLATTSNYVFSRGWYERVGDFLPLRYTHDWDFALRMAKQSRLRLVPEPLMRYRVHSSNTIRENQAAMIFEICWILAVHLPQHAADEAWFGQLPLEKRTDQLLHSIYVYGMDRVLSVLLAQNLAGQPERALRLLRPGDPARETCIRYIIAQLEQAGESSIPPPPSAPGFTGRLKQTVKRVIASGKS